MQNTYTTPELSHSALITIDTQQDTLDGQPLKIPGTSQALPNMRNIGVSVMTTAELMGKLNGNT